MNAPSPPDGAFAYLLKHTQRLVSITIMNSKIEQIRFASLYHDMRVTNWLPPWTCAFFEGRAFQKTFEDELQHELPKTHILFEHRQTAKLLALHDECDDALFFLPHAKQKYAVVHLTWNIEADPAWPHTLLYETIADFTEQAMVPAHEEFLDEW